MKHISWIIAFPLMLTTAHAASFDCGKASTSIEKIICGDAVISKMDVDLANAYQRVIEQSEDIQKETKDQQRWLTRIRNTCANANCLLDAYKTRIYEFTAIAKARSELLKQDFDAGTENGNQTPTSYVLRCDKHNKRVTVAERNYLPIIDSQYFQDEVSEFAIDPASLTKIAGTETHPLRLSASRKVYRCKLGSAVYRIVIEPYIFGGRIFGADGARDPVISLSIDRDGQSVFSNINFADADNRIIHRIQIAESVSSINVLALLNNPQLRVERKFALASFPKEWGRAIFEDIPADDADAELFIAVQRRDISAIRRALQNGANPNAKDITGFPPMALLHDGRQLAYWNHKLEEFNIQTNGIAKLLVSAGATGDVENIHGVTLLDYLLSEVPDSVIELLLANGANAQNGTPLVGAASIADANLIMKLIDSGADANAKARNGSNALWYAAGNGFDTPYDREIPPITEYAKCVRLLIQHGAKVQDAVNDSAGMPWLLVRAHGKDERLKIILMELIPYMNRDEIERAQKLAENYSAPLAQWLKEQLH